MTQMTARNKIRRGLDYLFDDHPYSASIAASWKIHEVEPEWFAKRGLPNTAGTNGPDLIYSRPFLEELTIAETCDLVLHEVVHVLNGHHFRFPKFAKLENWACDLAINSQLEEYYDKSGFIYQEGIFPAQSWRIAKQKAGTEEHFWATVFSKLPAGESAEFYLKHLRQALTDPNRPKPAKGAPTIKVKGNAGKKSQDQDSTEDSGIGIEGQDSAESADGQEDETDQDSQAGQTPARADDSATESKSGNDADNAEDEVGGPDSAGQVLPHPDADDPGAKAEAVEEWEQKVAEGVNAAKQAGNLPGWASELAKEYEHESVVNWKLELRQFMTQSSKVMNTYSRPNRRMSYRTDVILPSLGGKSLSEGCLLTDTSGSMDVRQDLGIVLPEVEKMMRMFPDSAITLMQADTRLIQSVTKRFTRYDFPLRIPYEWKGRGGTDLTEAIHKIAEDKNFNWLIVVSDMQWRVSSCPDPKIPTLWLTTREMHADYQKPKFGKVLGPINKE